MTEVFKVYGDFWVSNLFYEGLDINGKSWNVGNKVVSANGHFEGLLDEDGETMWLVNESTLRLLN